MNFYKYHASGNDYVVVDPRETADAPTPEQIRRICQRHFGIGSDGVLLGPLPSTRAAFALRIFNPDGSEAEKSGNGLRIFCRYLWDHHLVGDETFSVETKGGLVQGRVLDEGRRVWVEMGRVSFWSRDIPVAGDPREVLLEPITVGEATFRFCGATIGNPHCVIPVETLTSALAQTYGPLLEVHPLFPNRTNVQFLKVLDRNAIQIEIWERGAGYTLASGSSCCVAAAVARRLGRVDATLTVHMPGGSSSITVDDCFGLTVVGPVTCIGAGRLADEMFEAR